MSKLSREETVALADRVIGMNPSEYNRELVYFDQDRPVCLVGHMLAAVGVIDDELDGSIQALLDPEPDGLGLAYDLHENPIVEVFSESAAEWLAVVQSWTDARVGGFTLTWSDARRIAETEGEYFSASDRDEEIIVANGVRFAD